MTISRRDLLRAGLATAGGLLVARPLGALARPLGPVPQFDTSRASRLFPGLWVAHADMHNHSLFSDGDGDPALAYASMRSAGLDIAAMTDHSTLSWGLPATVCPESNCQSVAGINEETWAAQKVLADTANEDHAFVAIRGFEWSSPTIGHMNVWFSERWMDPLHTAGAGTGEGAAQFAHDDANLPAEAMTVLDEIVKQAPHTGVGMAAFYEWLTADASRPVWGGGMDGLAGFNHPGREPGRFSHFKRLPGLPSLESRIVSMEIFNRREDYIFEGTDSLAQSPLNECLNAGWRVGLSGVTDEHGTNWGDPTEKGRTGLLVTELTRAGVRQALRARRFFATRERGLRIDAAANDVQMGGTITAGEITFSLDIDKGSTWEGKTLFVQMLRRGARMPEVQANIPIVVPAPGDPLVSFTLPISKSDGDWVVLRITDPSRSADGRADAQWKAYGRAVAYASPFFLA